MQIPVRGGLVDSYRIFAAVAVIFFALAWFSCPTYGAEPKRVMLLHSFGPEFKPWRETSEAIRSELELQSRWPLDVTEHSLVSARASDEDSEALFVEYLRALFAKHPLDLVVAVGAPAARFIQQHRQQLFPRTPMVLAAVEQRRVQYSAITQNDTVAAVSIDHRALWENILRVLPDTKTLAVAIGNSPSEKAWLEDLRQEAKAFEGRLAFRWYHDLSFEQILEDASALPAHSAIYWSQMIVDAAGAVHEGERALKRLHAVANAPIFSYSDTFLTGETVGGPMLSVAEIGKQTAAISIRILGGEKAADIMPSPIGFAAPKYDWREMQHWGISESRLPSGSEILFREPTAWERYWLQILTICVALLGQTALIVCLIYEHRRRHQAELQSRNSMAELTYMNRRAAAGELSASISHEINQPLMGITTLGSAALRWLSADPPNVDRARASLTQIVDAGHRASDIVTSVRAMFTRDAPKTGPIDINDLIRKVLAIVRVDLQKNGVDVQTQLDDQLPPIEGDKVQLQQVVLNLVMNAIEAMHSAHPRVLKIQSGQIGPGTIRVSIEDSGTGIDRTKVDDIFKPLFTTKARGMGMGLSICKSIIESHHGRILISPGTNRGSIFCFELSINGDKNSAKTTAR